MARWLALLAVAGCYNPSIQPGGACSTTCPGDLVCIDHVCVPPGTTPDHPDAPMHPPIDAMVDASTIDGPPGDVDADTVPDNVDNCPSKANLDQHDEDADAIGDVCDPCPHLNGDAADGDGDGVGDMCDPEPAIAKQRILFFDPFTTAKSEWTIDTGTTRVGETLRFLGNNQAFSDLAVATGETRIEAGGTVVSAAATPHQLSIEFGEAVNGKYHYCEFYNSSGSTGDIGISKANSGTYTSVNKGHYPAPLPTGAWHMRIDESVSAQQIKLLTTIGGVAYPEVVGITNQASPNLTASGSISFYVQRADIRMDYFIVIETLP